MRFEMPLQSVQPKATMRDQPLKRSQVTENHLPKLSRGRSHGTKALRYHQEFLDSRQRQKNLAGLGIDGHAEVLCSLRGDKFRVLLVYHNPEGVTKREQGPHHLPVFLLRGGTNQPVVQVPKKTDPVRVSPR